MANKNPIQTAEFRARQQPKHGEKALCEAIGMRFPEDVDRVLRQMPDRQEYVRRAVYNAMLADGLMSPRKGAGPESTNSDRNNEDRLQESIETVKAAVEALRLKHPNWATLKVKPKIKLLQAQTLETRGAAISSQTLYRPWIRKLW